MGERGDELCKQLDLSGCKHVTDAAIASALNTPTCLRVLRLAHTCAGPEVLTMLASAPLSTSQAPPHFADTAQNIRRCRAAALRELDLSYCMSLDFSELSILGQDGLLTLMLSRAVSLLRLSLRGVELGNALQSLRAPELRQLDLMAARFLRSDGKLPWISRILLACPKLRALNTREIPAQPLCSQQGSAPGTVSPRLGSLEVGWGIPRPLLWGLAQPALTQLVVGLGGALDDDLLGEIAKRCPGLAVLRLQLQTVTQAGVLQVVQRCRRLRTVDLQHCTGPFGDCLMPALAALPELTRLAVLGGASAMSTDGWRALRQTSLRLEQLGVMGGSAVNTSDIIGCLRVHAEYIAHLHLDSCGGARSARLEPVDRPREAMERHGEQREGDPGGTPDNEAGGVLHWILQEGLPALRTLHLRHCGNHAIPVTSSAADGCAGDDVLMLICGCCPQLQALSVDMCEMPTIIQRPLKRLVQDLGTRPKGISFFSLCRPPSSMLNCPDSDAQDA
eukprot:gene2774-3555_t